MHIEISNRLYLMYPALYLVTYLGINMIRADLLDTKLDAPALVGSHRSLAVSCRALWLYYITFRFDCFQAADHGFFGVSCHIRLLLGFLESSLSVSD